MQIGFRSLMVITAFLIITSWISNNALAKSECSDWAKIISEQLGCTFIGCGKMGVDLYSRGLVSDQKILKNMGFKFCEGPYHMSAFRIDMGRYLISVQSMTRRDDQQKKEIALKTKADTLYPVRIPPAPEGQYTWNSAIQYDMEKQLGMKSVYEYEEVPRSFVDVRITEPDKIAKFGFPGIEKNDSNYQLLYRGNNRWELHSAGNKGNGILIYEKACWIPENAISEKHTGSHMHGVPLSSSDEMKPSISLNGITPANDQKRILFSRVESADMVYNNTPNKLMVYQGQQKDGAFFLVKIQGHGMILVDLEKKKISSAEGAAPVPDGTDLELSLKDVSFMASSSVDVLIGESKKRIEVWWNHNRLAFTVIQSPQGVSKK